LNFATAQFVPEREPGATRMPRMLSNDQIARYHRDNVLTPLQGTSAERAHYYRGRLERYEAAHGGPPLPASALRKTHVLLPWAAELVREPRVLDAVEDVLGPDVLVFNSTFFIKEPGAPTITAWHQDATHFGLRPYEHVTAWLALSTASRESGCMQVVSGSSALGQLHHQPQAFEHSINAGGQAIVEDFNAEPVIAVELSPGQFSLHHTLVIHSSAPNRGTDRRIGIGVSYIPTRVFHVGSRPMGATLVRGEDRFGHFELEPDPRDGSAQQAERAHEAAYRRYREGYDEQIECHRAAYSAQPAK